MSNIVAQNITVTNLTVTNINGQPYNSFSSSCCSNCTSYNDTCFDCTSGNNPIDPNCQDCEKPPCCVGATGPQGPQGATGRQGIRGPRGPQGAQGTRGTQGVLGTQGSLGTIGDIGSTGIQGSQQLIGSTGSIGSQGVRGSSSDIRLKSNIETLLNVLPKLDQIRGVSYKFIDEKYGIGNQVGVIAQEIQQVYPELVFNISDEYLGVDYPHLTGVLLQAIKEQQEQIKELNFKIYSQQEQIDEIIKKYK